MERMESFCYIKPSHALAPYVKHYWALRIDRTGGQPPAGERTVPVGCMSLIFHRASPLVDSGKGTMQPRAFVSGISSGYADLTGMGDLDMLVVVFQPLAAGLFFTPPADEFRDAWASLVQLGSGELKALERDVCSEPDTGKAVGMIERYLMRRLLRSDMYNHTRLSPALRLASDNPDATVASLADAACLSNRQFNRAFSSAAGANPKEFLRIVRFQRALYVMQTKPALNFAQVAAHAGYFDQPHMIREFREFSGYTPATYLAVCPPYSDYFSAV